MKNISYVRYSPTANSDELSAKVVKCYRKVFADGPWHEWLQCPVCKRYWGKKDENLLQELNFQHCGTGLIDFWSEEQVAKDILHEITANTSCWLAIHRDNVVGFCWGYPIEINTLEDKLCLSIQDNLSRQIGTTKLVAYQDEVGVLSEYRGVKIAKTMVKYRLDDFISQGLKVGIVRTKEKPEPSETFLWYKKIGYSVIASYPKDDGRVILARSFNGLMDHF